MSLFKRKKDNDDDMLLDMSEITEEDNLFERSRSFKWGEGTHLSPHAMTADEIAAASEAENIVAKPGISPAAQTVFKKVTAIESIPVKKNVIEEIVMVGETENRQSAAVAEQPDNTFLRRCHEVMEGAAPARATAKPQEKTPSVDEIVANIKRQAFENNGIRRTVEPEEAARAAMLDSNKNNGAVMREQNNPAVPQTEIKAKNTCGTGIDIANLAAMMTAPEPSAIKANYGDSFTSDRQKKEAEDIVKALLDKIKGTNTTENAQPMTAAEPAVAQKAPEITAAAVKEPQKAPVETMAQPIAEKPFSAQVVKTPEQGIVSEAIAKAEQSTAAVPKNNMSIDERKPVKVDVIAMNGEDGVIKSVALDPVKSVTKAAATAAAVSAAAATQTAAKSVTAEVKLDDAIKSVTPVFTTPSEGATVSFDSVKTHPAEEKSRFAKKYITAEEETATVQFKSLEENDAVSKNDLYNIEIPEDYDDEYGDDSFDDDDEYIDDYENLDDAPRLKTSLIAKISRKTVQTAMTLIVSAFLVAFTLPVLQSFGVTTYANVGGVLLALIINYDVFGCFNKLFKGKITSDFAVLCISVVVIIQLCLSGLKFGSEFAVTGVAATLLLAFNAWGERVRLKRIYNGLCMVATGESKRAIKIVDDQRKASVLSGGSVEGDAVVVTTEETDNILGYMKKSAAPGPLDRNMNKICLLVLAVAAILGVAIGLIKGMDTGITVFALSLALGYPISAMFISELPLKLISDQMSAYGGMIAGFSGASELDSSNALTVDVTELFPDSSVKLVNMKAFKNNDLAKALYYAAAVALEAKSPLSDIFRRIIGDEAMKKIPHAEDVNYEDKMGISGWIGEKRIFIGNRNLMQGHGIQVSAMSVDQEILKNGYFPVYVACGDVNCMLLSVRYDVDPDIAYELQKLANTGMTVLVSNRDPNVTAQMVCDYFGLSDDSVSIMSQNGLNLYKNITEPKESTEAPASYSGNVCGLMSAASSSIRLGSTIRIIAVLAIILSVASVIAIFGLAFKGLLGGFLTPLNIAAVQLISLFISVLAAYLRR